jgi:hypothetical protein
MPLDQPRRDNPGIVPVNNLRLPDALTVTYGPAPLLSEFVLRGDQAVRACGISLRIRHDFEELAYLNRHEVARGTWVPLPMMFDPRCSRLESANAFWLSGEDDGGEIVLTGAFRLFDWRDTSLREQAGNFFCDTLGRPHHCIVTASAAASITGQVCWCGSLWVRPDHRHHHLSELVGRLGRAFAVAQWPVDWMMCLVVPVLVDKRIASGYGYKHFSRSVFFPKCHLGDLEMVVAYVSPSEVYADLIEVLESRLGDSSYFTSSGASRRRFENIVTRTSSDEADQGSINLS